MAAQRPPMKPTPEQQIERLEKTIADGRELLRDLNSASKDLRKSIREARDLARSEIAQQLTTEVTQQVQLLGEVTQKQMRAAVDRVNAEFDKLGAILLGIDRAEPLEVMVRKVAEKPGRGRVEPYVETVRYDTDILDCCPDGAPDG